MDYRLKHFIIAGNHQQFKEFVNKKLSSLTESFRFTDFVYVSGPEVFRGYSNPHGWFIGTWRERPDIREILSILPVQYHNEPTPQSIIDAWTEINHI